MGTEGGKGCAMPYGGSAVNSHRKKKKVGVPCLLSPAAYGGAVRVVVRALAGKARTQHVKVVVQELAAVGECALQNCEV